MVLSLAISISTFLSQIALVDIDILQYSTIPYTFMMITLYGWFRFSRIAFLGEQEHTTIERIALVMAIGTIVFAFMRALLGNEHPINQVLYFLRFVWILAYEGLIITLIIVGTIKVKRRIPKDDPHQAKLTDIVYMTIAYAVCSVLYVLDTLYMATIKIAGNWALFGAQTAFIFFMAFIYRAFFVKLTKL